jgi:ankyrin repeat protein
MQRRRECLRVHTWQHGYRVVDEHVSPEIASLLFASRRGNTETAQRLLDENDRVNDGDTDGRTALCVASTPEMVELLVRRGAFINEPAGGGWTPLMLATRGGRTLVVGSLLKNGARVNLRNEHQHTALTLAIVHNHVDICLLLLKKHASVNVDVRLAYYLAPGRVEEEKMSPLKLAISFASTAIVKLLLEHCADVHGRHLGVQRSPLRLALATRKLEMCDLLLAHGALSAKGVGYTCTNTHSESMHTIEQDVKNLLRANTTVSNACAQLVIVHGGPIRPNEYTENSHREELIENAIEVRTEHPWTQDSHRQDVDISLRDKTKVPCAPRVGCLLLPYLGFDSVTCRNMVTHVRDRVYIDRKYLSQVTTAPLMLACKSGNLESVKICLKGSDTSRTSPGLETPLHVAATRPIAELLLSRTILIGDPRCLDEQMVGVEYNYNQIGVTPLMCAARDGRASVVAVLLEHKADVDASDSKGWTALMYASAHSRVNAMKVLLSYRADTGKGANASNHYRRNSCLIGETSLIFAAKAGSTHAVRMLLDHGARINFEGKIFNSAVKGAATKGHTQVVLLLLKRGTYTESRYGLLDAAFESKNLETLNQLLLLDYEANTAFPWDDPAAITLLTSYGKLFGRPQFGLIGSNDLAELDLAEKKGHALRAYGLSYIKQKKQALVAHTDPNIPNVLLTLISQYDNLNGQQDMLHVWRQWDPLFELQTGEPDVTIAPDLF